MDGQMASSTGAGTPEPKEGQQASPLTARPRTDAFPTPVGTTALEDVGADVQAKWTTVLEANPELSPAQTIKSGPTSVGPWPLDAKPMSATVQLIEAATVQSGPVPASETSAQPQIDPGDFSLLEKIGEGGMGIVYAARQHSLSRDIAVKMMRADKASNVDLYRQFAAEAMVTGDLEHPNIVPVHMMGTDRNRNIFFAMKLVQGVPWSLLLHPEAEPDEAKRRALEARAHAMTARDHLGIFLKVCDAIAYAHSRNIIHRDLKPGNVMAGAFGEVLVVDWGLAVDVRKQPLPPFKGLLKSEASAVAGTPYYMAPEQVTGDGNQLSPATDVFILGAILYELLTGAAPYSNTKPWKDIVKVIAAANVPSPVERAGKREVPRELAAIAMKAMAREPADRFGSVADLQKAVDRFLSGEAQRAESEQITVAAGSEVRRLESDFAQMRSARAYEQIAGLQSRLQRALSLWAENREAFNLLVQLTESYVARALANGDLLLARSQLGFIESLWPDQAEKSKNNWEKWRRRIDAAEASRRSRQRNLRLAVVTAVVLAVCVMAGGAYSLDRISTEKRTALLERNNADLERAKATQELTKRVALEQERNAVRTSQFEQAQAESTRAKALFDEAAAVPVDAAKHEKLQEVEGHLSRAMLLLGEGADKFASTPDERVKFAGLLTQAKRQMIDACELHFAVALNLNNLALAGEKIEMAKRAGFDRPDDWSGRMRDRIANEVERVFAAAQASVMPGRPDPEKIYSPGDALNTLVALKSPLCARAIEKQLTSSLDTLTQGKQDLSYDNAPLKLAVEALGWVSDASTVNLLFPLTGKTWKTGAAIDDRLRGEALASLCRLGPTSDRKLYSDLEDLIWCEPETVNSTFYRMAEPAWRLYTQRVTEGMDQMIRNLYWAQQWAAAGRKLVAAGRCSDAIPLLDKALEPQPACPFRRDHLALVQTLRGTAFESLGQHDQALEAYNEGLRLNEWAQKDFKAGWKAEQLQQRRAEILSRRGYVWQRKGDAAKAMADLDKALEYNPQNVGALNNRGIVRALGGNPDGAIQDLDRAAEFAKDNPDVLCNRGNVRTTLGRIDEAIADYGAALQLNPRLADAHVNRGRALLLKGDTDAAAQDVAKALEINSQFAEAYLLRAAIREKTGDKAGTKADRDKALALQPALASVYESGFPPKDPGFAGVIWEPDRTLKSYTFPTEAYLQRGQVLSQRKDTDGALRAFEDVLAVDPDNVQGLFGRGRARLAKRQYGPALTDMDAVLRQTPTDSNAWLGKGLALLATGKKDDAQGCIDKSRKFSEAEVRQYIKDEAKVQERLKAWNKEIDSLVERVQKESAAKP